MRWIVCALLFAAVVLSYIDRLVLSVLKPTLQGLYHWSDSGYGDVVSVFQAAYGIGFLLFGRLVDRIGARFGYALAMIVWTAAHMAHAFFTSMLGFGLCGSCSASANPAPIPPRSPRSPNGFRGASGRSPSASSTPAPMSARSSRR